jgi:hypothetical protein
MAMPAARAIANMQPGTITIMRPDFLSPRIELLVDPSQLPDLL